MFYDQVLHDSAASPSLALHSLNSQRLAASAGLVGAHCHLWVEVILGNDSQLLSCMLPRIGNFPSWQPFTFQYVTKNWWFLVMTANHRSCFLRRIDQLGGLDESRHDAKKREVNNFEFDKHLNTHVSSITFFFSYWQSKYTLTKFLYISLFACALWC